ncbi:MAG: ABC transporter substrate-binding protein [Burkholderiales bacterium]
MNARRRVLAAAALCAFAPGFGRTQPAKRTIRLGVLGAASAATTRHFFSALLDGLRERGYVEGRNLVIDYRWAEGMPERYPQLAAELLAGNPDLLFTGPDTAALALKSLTSKVPIVFVVGFDPVGIGVVQSLARPGANVTGFSVFLYELTGKRFALLKESVPSLARLAVLHRAGDAKVLSQLKELEQQAGALRVQILPFGFSSAEDFAPAFKAMAEARAGGVLAIADALLFVHRKQLAELALQYRIPSSFETAEFADAGALMAYSVNFTAQYRRAATLIDRILKGASPAEIPVQQATTFEFVINLKTAKALGIKIPNLVLVQATRVIE